MEKDNAPIRLLQSINKNKKFSRLWREIDEYRDRERNNWPAWCFLPLDVWPILVVMAEPQFAQKNDPITLGKINHFAAFLAAIGSWRPTQDIFIFDNEAFEAIAKSDIDAKISVENILHLPAWSIYIKWGNHDYDGFFATLIYESANSKKYLELTFLHDNDDNLPKPHLVRIPLQKSLSISEAINSYKRENIKKQQEIGINSTLTEEYFDEINVNNAAIAVSLILYICSDSPEIDGITAAATISRPRSQKIKNGWRIFPPENPNIHAVAEKIGYSLRKYKSKAQIELSNQKMPPHVRRGHFTRYWYGPRNSPYRCYDFRWIPPLPINLLEDEGAE
ncbi:hypothetical protein [Desulfovibrio sp. ZJ200]|uniref:hypothetical protein n=1 Tax=Desulfovibrio sp. ZJ200 TaxID=2709792 RepID=UPI0013ED9165|nr:hypothetical protein [Desulfovibrio sp. ZJ200]